MSTTIDRSLKLVIGIEQGGVTSYIHAAPISREVFERYYLVIAKVFTKIFNGGLGSLAGTRVAALLLRDEARDMDILDGPTGVELGLFGELKRLASVLAPRDTGGWETIPLQEAIDRKFIDAEDWQEVENALAFFTVASRMMRRKELDGIIGGAMGMWGAEITSLNSTEYKDSLPISTPAVSIGVKETLSSIPS